MIISIYEGFGAIAVFRKLKGQLYMSLKSTCLKV